MVLTTVGDALSRPEGERPRFAARRPNLLLVSIDSLRADRVHAYGYPRETTPTIDRIAAEGALFRHAISPSSWTLPTHATLLTGLPPEAHGLTGTHKRLSERAVLLSEVLQDTGYLTGAIVSGPLLRSIHGYDQGFDFYDDDKVAAQLDSSRGETSSWVMQGALDWLDAWMASDHGRPFFLFLHMWDVHYDYAPPAPYDTLFDPHYEGDLTGDGFTANRRIRPDMPPADLEHLKALYDGEIRYTDENIGKLIEWLERADALDDTIVAITADHGDEFFEHGMKGHAKTLYDEMVRIPLVMRYPKRIPAGRIVEQQVRLMDVAPTLLGLAGIEGPSTFARGRTPPELASRDLSSWVTGDATAEFPDLVAFGFVAGWNGPLHSVRTIDRKILVRNKKMKWRRPSLFFLDVDPEEHHDRKNEFTRDARAPSLFDLLKLSTAHWERVGDLAEPLALSRDHEERLRALGYLQP